MLPACYSHVAVCFVHLKVTAVSEAHPLMLMVRHTMSQQSILSIMELVCFEFVCSVPAQHSCVLKQTAINLFTHTCWHYVAHGVVITQTGLMLASSQVCRHRSLVQLAFFHQVGACECCSVASCICETRVQRNTEAPDLVCALQTSWVDRVQLV